MLRDPILKPEEDQEDNVIYVVPPWAVKDRRKPAKQRRESWWATIKERMEGSRFIDAFLFEIKLLAAVLVIGAIVVVGLRTAYMAKSASGVDTVPGVHGGDVLPFLR